MSIASIQAWLRANGDFTAGVEMYRTYGRPTSAELFLFGLGENSVSRDRLRNALEALLDTSVESTGQHTMGIRARHALVAPEERAAHRANVDDQRQGIRDEDLPAELRDLRQQIRGDYRLMNVLRGQALRIPDGMELRTVALRIAELHDRIRAGWMVIETWRDTGRVVAYEPTKEVDQVALLKERASLRSQLSPARIAARGTTAEKVEAWRKRLAEINTLLDEPVQA